MPWQQCNQDNYKAALWERQEQPTWWAWCGVIWRSVLDRLQHEIYTIIHGDKNYNRRLNAHKYNRDGSNKFQKNPVK